MHHLAKKQKSILQKENHILLPWNKMAAALWDILLKVASNYPLSLLFTMHWLWGWHEWILCICGWCGWSDKVCEGRKWGGFANDLECCYMRPPVLECYNHFWKIQHPPRSRVCWILYCQALLPRINWTLNCSFMNQGQLWGILTLKVSNHCHICFLIWALDSAMVMSWERRRNNVISATVLEGKKVNMSIKG